MKIAYFDCFAGISGDMTVSSLVHCGIDFDEFQEELKKLNLSGYSLGLETAMKHGITGSRFIVKTDDTETHRTFVSIADLINKSHLDPQVKDSSIKIFERLAEAEAKIHNADIEKVTFHEVGAIDSIIDIVGASLAIAMLGIEKVYASKIHLGTGFTKSMHGTIPVPAPATIELLKGIPTYSTGIESELTTPTGAAILSHFASSFGPIPNIEIESIGYGAGTRDLDIPNMVRVIVGEETAQAAREQVTVIETNIDDMNPEFYDHLFDSLFEKGALDVFTIPLTMKKTRPAALLKVIGKQDVVKDLTDIIFRETTTAGIRFSTMDRITQPRKIITVDTVYGPVTVKVIGNSEYSTMSPEYEDCKRLAQKTGVPIKVIYDAAKNKAGHK